MPLLKNSVGIWAFDPNTLCFEIRACPLEMRNEVILRQTKHAVDGLNKAVDRFEHHFYVGKKNVRQTPWPSGEEHSYGQHIDYVEPWSWLIEDITEHIEHAGSKPLFTGYKNVSLLWVF